MRVITTILFFLCFFSANAQKDDAAIFQNAVTIASNSTQKITVVDRLYQFNSNITIPKGVQVWFTSEGKFEGSALIDGGIIQAPYRSQIFGENITIHPEAVEEKFSMCWYGAKGDGSNEYDKLQKGINACVFGNRIHHLYWPSGNYHASKGLVFRRDDNADGQTEFIVGYILEGESKAYGGTRGETILTVDNGNSFGINLQRVKGFVAKGILLIGQNEELASLSPVDILENQNTNWNNGNSDNPQCPHIGWSIDGLGTPSVPLVNRYKDFADLYTDVSSGGSTDVTIEHCGARYWVVGFGISMSGTVANGDMVEFRSCWSDNNKVCFATGHSQNRTNLIYKPGIWGHFETAFDCHTYGETIGNPMQVSGGNMAGYGRYMCKLNNFYSNGMSIDGMHFELLYSLGGNAENNGSLYLNNCWINLAGDLLPGDGSAIHHPVTIFRGGNLTITNSLLTYYSAGYGPMSFAAKNALFDNVQLDNLPFNTYPTGQTQFRHCKRGIFTFGEGERIDFVAPNIVTDQRPYFITDMSFVTTLGTRDFFNSFTRKKINRTGVGAYGLKDIQLIPIGSVSLSNIVDPDSRVGYTHAEFSLPIAGNEFKVIRTGDHLLIRTTDEFGKNAWTTIGQVVSKSADGLVTIKNIGRGITATTYPLFLYRPQELLPVFAVGDCHKGSVKVDSVFIEGSSVSLPIGITINSPFFPEGTYLVDYDGKGTATFSNPAIATVGKIDIISSDWQATVYGSANPMLVDKIGFKRGDIIWNMRPDLYARTIYWICTESGISGTIRKPSFKAYNK